MTGEWEIKNKKQNSFCDWLCDLYSDNANPFLFPIKTSSKRHSFKRLIGTGRTARVFLEYIPTPTLLLLLRLSTLITLYPDKFNVGSPYGTEESN